ncbi:hypothetical protein [Moritella sp.]|uniref:hypothetical protein n=1 Tax=Moritella sp. TaxID=78556 RepID=UPI0025CFBB92|nr:hypothetical protein [Moritella sp.]MCJ8352307.1 hypothetical protein [Moritella sp.]
MFNLSRLTKRELIRLNTQIIERLKELEFQQTSEDMNDFLIGDKVSFTPPGEKEIKGIVIKKNKKTIAVLDEFQHRWNIPPAYLIRQGSENVIDAEWKVISRHVND